MEHVQPAAIVPGFHHSNQTASTKRGTRYHETTAKSIVNAVKGMRFSWSISPYRGCIHACTYCYGRASHSFLGYDTGADFEH